MAKDNESLERAIIGALRSTIRDHGPITADKISSAAKRILGQLGNAKADGLARALAQRRWAGVTEEERSEHQAAAAATRWASMTKKQRSEEMSRRRREGIRRRAERDQKD